MTGNSYQETLNRAAWAAFNQVADPGNAGTIQMDRDFDSICSVEVTGSANETRLLPLPASVPLGTKCLVLLRDRNTSYTVTVSQADSDPIDAAGTTSVVLNAVGSFALFQRLLQSDGTEAWRLVSSNGGSVKTQTTVLAIEDFRATGTGAHLGNSAGTPAGAFGRTNGAHGTAGAILVSQAASGASITNIARCKFAVPSNYVAGQPITLTVYAAETVGAATVATTIDAEVFRLNAASATNAVDGADICATAAIDVAAVTPAAKVFTITPTAVVPGDVLDIELTGVSNDTGGTVGTIIAITKVEIALAVAA